MDLTELRLIANPVHLSEVKVKKKHHKTDVDYLDKLKETISIKYRTIYLSEFNLSEIESKIDDYINDITTSRTINDIVNKIIEEVIDKNKFDFCIPFD